MAHVGFVKWGHGVHDCKLVSGHSTWDPTRLATFPEQPFTGVEDSAVELLHPGWVFSMPSAVKDHVQEA